MDKVSAFCSVCGAEIQGELHVQEQCVAFLLERTRVLEHELAHTVYILKHFKEEKWKGGAGYVIDDAEKWLKRAPSLIAMGVHGRKPYRAPEDSK